MPEEFNEFLILISTPCGYSIFVCVAVCACEFIYYHVYM